MTLDRVSVVLLRAMTLCTATLLSVACGTTGPRKTRIELDPAQVCCSVSSPQAIAVLRQRVDQEQEAALAVLRQAVVDTENGRLPGVERVVSFGELTSWPYVEGLAGMPQELRDLNGKTVLMAGHLVPIEHPSAMTECLLIESVTLWDASPPGLEGVVYVELPANQPMDWSPDLHRLIGRFTVEENRLDGFVVHIYRLRAERVERIAP